MRVVVRLDGSRPEIGHETRGGHRLVDVGAAHPDHPGARREARRHRRPHRHPPRLLVAAASGAASGEPSATASGSGVATLTTASTGASTTATADFDRAEASGAASGIASATGWTPATNSETAASASSWRAAFGPSSDVDDSTLLGSRLDPVDLDSLGRHGFDLDRLWLNDLGHDRFGLNDLGRNHVGPNDLRLNHLSHVSFGFDSLGPGLDSRTLEGLDLGHDASAASRTLVSLGHHGLVRANGDRGRSWRPPPRPSPPRPGRRPRPRRPAPSAGSATDPSATTASVLGAASLMADQGSALGASPATSTPTISSACASGSKAKPVSTAAGASTAPSGSSAGASPWTPTGSPGSSTLRLVRHDLGARLDLGDDLGGERGDRVGGGLLHRVRDELGLDRRLDRGAPTRAGSSTISAASIGASSSSEEAAARPTTDRMRASLAATLSPAGGAGRRGDHEGRRRRHRRRGARARRGELRHDRPAPDRRDRSHRDGGARDGLPGAATALGPSRPLGPRSELVGPQRAVHRVVHPQHDPRAARVDPRLDPAGDLALGDPRQHLGVRRRRLRPEVAVVRGQVAEVFRDGLHRAEAVLEPLERAREGPVRDGENLVGSDHVTSRFLSVPGPTVPECAGSRFAPRGAGSIFS